MISEYLTQVLAVTSLTLLLALAGTGYLYKESLKENGRLENVITSLKIEIETCRSDIILIEKDKEDLEGSLTNIQNQYNELENQFDTIENKLAAKKCRGTKNEKTVDINVADDIADTLRLLRQASCLSNKDCERP